MKLAIAQIKVVSGEIETNLKRHLTFIKRAGQEQADLILFPELSLTNYEPRKAAEYALNEKDSRFEAFQQASDAHQMIIGVGVPIQQEQGVTISQMLFHPSEKPVCYSKQIIHPNEEAFFIAGNQEYSFSFEDEVVSPAICYETVQPEFIHKVAQKGTHVYLSSVAKKEMGLVNSLPVYAQIARQNGWITAMSNFVGGNSEFECFGNSSIWNAKGERVVWLNELDEGLVMYNTKTEESKAVIIEEASF